MLPNTFHALKSTYLLYKRSVEYDWAWVIGPYAI